MLEDNRDADRVDCEGLGIRESHPPGWSSDLCGVRHHSQCKSHPSFFALFFFRFLFVRVFHVEVLMWLVDVAMLIHGRKGHGRGEVRVEMSRMVARVGCVLEPMTNTVLLCALVGPMVQGAVLLGVSFRGYALLI